MRASSAALAGRHDRQDVVLALIRLSVTGQVEETNGRYVLAPPVVMGEGRIEPMSTSSRLTLPGARPRPSTIQAAVPKPPPPEPRPAARAEPKRTPERVRADIAADREAAARHHLARLDDAARALAERVLADGVVRIGRRHASERHLVRWAELTGRLVWVSGKLWGDPFRPWRDEGRRPTDEELAASHERYRAHVLASPALMARLPGLRGKVIACLCPPGVPCHGDVLLGLPGREAAGDARARGSAGEDAAAGMP